MIKNTAQLILKYLPPISWALFFLTLPVTSFPYFPPTLGGSALVRPLSIYPLMILMVFVTIPHLLRKPIYPTILALAPFLTAVTLSTLLSFLGDIQPLLGVSVTDRALRGIITLLVGVGIFLTTAFYPGSKEDLRNAMRWLYGGFILALIWGTMQIILIVNFNQQYYRWMKGIHEHISVRRLFTTRVSGLTYEPNWFAEQLTFLLMPWLLASVLTGYTVFRWRWRWITIELLLLAWSIVVLVFTFSRAGIIVLGVLGMLSLLLFRNIPDRTNIGQRISIGSKTRRLLETGLVIALLIGFVFIAGQKNEFFARIWSYWGDKNNTSLQGYFEYLGFSARFGYGETAFNVYKNHPVIGVGLGNFAFYFEEELPDRPVAAIPEILRLITPEEGRNRLITPKNFYMRILAESGVVGLGTFLVFLFAILGCAIFLWLSPRRYPSARFWGIAGILGVVSFLLVAFTFDSFAIPNMWVVFGLITAAAWLSFKSQESTRDLPSPAEEPLLPNTKELQENLT